MIRAFSRVGVVTALVILAGCGGESSSGPTVGATLAASPSSLAFSDTGTIRQFFLTTQPSGGRLEWQVTAKPTWLVIEPSSGIVSGSIVTVKVTASGLATSDPGTFSGKIDLVSSGGTASIAVSATVAADPLITVSQVPAVAATADTASFTVTNSGRGTLSWQAVAPAAWMTLSPASGFLSRGQSATVRVTVDKTSLAIGAVPVTITVKSNARTGDVAVPFSVNVAATPKLVLSTARLAYPQGVNSKSFVISNPGKGPLTWSAGAKDSWLTLSPSSGTVPAGGSANVTATIARGAVPGGEGSGTLTLNSDAINGAQTLAIQVTSSTGLTLGSQVLNHRVIDAEFSPSASLLVTISASPNQLNIIDVETGIQSVVALPLAATAVSIRPDGAFAAVGHDGYVTYVDLAKKTIVRTYQVTADVLDVVLATNGYLYVYPRRDQWTSIFSIDLATGTQSAGSATIYAGTLGRLHPSGDFMYGANNGLSPSDFEKYDIRSGPVKMLYDSPYHGDYAFNGNLWFSEDGTRIFARSGNVFRSSPVRSEDLLYAGKLTVVGAITWAADSKARNRVYALANASSDFFTTRTPSISVFESGFLAPMGTVALPKMTGGNGAGVDVDGYFLFPNADGTRLYALTKAVPSAGLAKDWALAVIDAMSLP